MNESVDMVVTNPRFEGSYIKGLYMDKQRYTRSKMNLAIFDLDGTLIESINETDFFYAFNETLKKSGVKTVTRQEYDGLDLWSGHGFEGLQEKLRKLSKALEARSFMQLFDKLYPECFGRALREGKMKLFEDVISTFSLLRKKDIKIAVSTNTGRTGAELKLRTWKLEAFVDVLVTVDECEPKPDPEGLEFILEKTNTRAEDAVFIGDSKIDAEASRRASIRYIMIDRRQEHTASGLQRVESLSEILDIFV